MLDLTVSIVTYNHVSQIGEALRALDRCWPDDLSGRIWVIENGSSDGTDALVRDLIPSLRLPLEIRRSADGNIGFGAGHNLILPELESHCHMIMNPDIAWLDTASLKTLLATVQQPDVGMAVPRIVDHEGRLQYLCRRDPTVLDLLLRLLPSAIGRKRRGWHEMRDHDYGTSFDVPFASGCLMLVRTDLWRELGGFDVRFFLYAEDADLSRRLRERQRIVYQPEASVRHDWQRGSYRKPRQALIHLRSLIRYFNKWGWRWS